MQLVLNALVAGSLAALVAGGLGLMYGVLGAFNMALGQIVLLTGLVTWWLVASISAPLWIAVPCGLMAAAALSLLTFEVFVDPFVRRHRFLPLVTTIAWSMMLDAAVLLLFGERPKSIPSGDKVLFSFGDGVINLQQCVLVLMTVMVLIATAWILHRTALGRKFRAVTQHEGAARSLGINATLLSRILFVVSGTLAGAGGIFIGIDMSLSPTLAFPFTIKAYAAVIAGGRGSLWGAVIAAYAIALAEQLLVGIRWFGVITVPAGYQQAVALAVIVGFLLWRPQGLFASRSRSV